MAGTVQALEEERTMIDSFVLLTPILMLGVIALLGFVGCSFEGTPPAGPILTAIHRRGRKGRSFVAS